MRTRLLIECSIDLSKPVEEVSAVISNVITLLPHQKLDILRALDFEIGSAINDIEMKQAGEPTDQE